MSARSTPCTVCELAMSLNFFASPSVQTFLLWHRLISLKSFQMLASRLSRRQYVKYYGRTLVGDATVKLMQ